MSGRAGEVLAGAIPIDWPLEAAPRLHVVVDTEESFDWSGPFRRDAVDVRALRSLHLAQRLLDRWRVVPTYVVTWAVLASDEGCAILRGLLADGRCTIGAHLHPWITPPHEEEPGPRTSYAGNLPPRLEAAKLRALGERIAERFGRPPTVYKAGRYGLGPASAATLASLGYEVDLSAYPHRDFGPAGGPDYRRAPDRPFWFGPQGRLLGLPMTCGHVGPLAGWSALTRRLGRPRAERLHLPGVLARTGLLERVTLTPEGFTSAEQARLVRAELARGRRVLCLSWHSPSLEPGNTPYAPDRAARDALLGRIEAVLELVLGELGGVPATPAGLRAEAERLRPAPD